MVASVPAETIRTISTDGTHSTIAEDHRPPRGDEVDHPLGLGEQTPRGIALHLLLATPSRHHAASALPATAYRLRHSYRSYGASLRRFGVSRPLAFLGAFLVLADNALMVESRFILMDSMLMLFGLGAVYFYLIARSIEGRRRWVWW